MKRRTLLTAAALAATFARARAQPLPGLPAGPDLLASAAGLRGVSEGTGGGTVHVLFTPWCHVSPDIWRATRGSLGAARIHWIPFSGGQPEGSQSVERFLSNPSPGAVPALFTRLQPLAFRPPTPLSDAQDAAVSGFASLAIRDTGHGLVTPTIVYSFGSGRVRVVPGGLSADDFLRIAASAD